jgi:threonine dehydrogenase-like Zn-dependent dehydrogenase
MRKPVREVRELLKKADVTEAQLAARMATAASGSTPCWSPRIQVPSGHTTTNRVSRSSWDCELTKMQSMSFAKGGENLGGQAEAIRAPFADGTLVKIPESARGDDAVLTRLLPLTDVMGTGYHSVVLANLRAGKTIIVIGDGAVGLCAVLSAKILGAGRIILMGHNPDRLKLGQRFGATDIISTRAKAPLGNEQVSPPPELSRTTSWAGFHLGLAIDDTQAVAEAVQMTGGGAESVAECVGLKSSFDLAIGVARPGGVVGFVGVPHVTKAIDLGRMFNQNISLRGGVAPVRGYIPDLMDQVLAGKIDPSPVLEMSVDLEGVSEGYAAMDSRKKIKVMVRP